MQAYDFNMRSGSFLDSDHKLHNKFITTGKLAPYAKLVQLRVCLKEEMRKLKRLYSSKAAQIKEAIISQDVIK